MSPCVIIVYTLLPSSSNMNFISCGTLRLRQRWPSSYEDSVGCAPQNANPPSPKSLQELQGHKSVSAPAKCLPYAPKVVNGASGGKHIYRDSSLTTQKIDGPTPFRGIICQPAFSSESRFYLLCRFEIEPYFRLSGFTVSDRSEHHLEELHVPPTEAACHVPNIPPQPMLRRKHAINTSHSTHALVPWKTLQATS